MTTLPLSPPPHAHNQQTSETCTALTLQSGHTLESAEVLRRDRPTRKTVLAFAEQVERRVQAQAVLAGFADNDIHTVGQP